MSQYKVNTYLLTGVIGHETDISFQRNRTDDRIFDLHEVSQIVAIESMRNRTEHNITSKHNRTGYNELAVGFMYGKGLRFFPDFCVGLQLLKLVARIADIGSWWVLIWS
jgi:hypothetical protein